MTKTWVTSQSWIEPTIGKTGNEVRAVNSSTDRLTPVEESPIWDGKYSGTAD